MACNPGRDPRSIFNQIAVSANNAETLLNVAQTLDTQLLVSKDTIINLNPRREVNTDELTGKEEPDFVYDLGFQSSTSFSFPFAQAQHFGFAYAYGLGSVSTAAVGSGYTHTITPLADLCHPSFTAAMRYGQTIFKRRYYSMFIDTVTATFERDNWAQLATGIVGTGRHDNDFEKETVTDGYDETTLTLAANGVLGTTAQERLDNVHFVRVQNPSTLAWEDVEVAAVSAATPAVLTITQPGVATDVTSYEIIYRKASPDAWTVFPSIVEESPLKVNDLVIKFGGLWNGSAYLGGHQISDEVQSIVHNFNNQQAIEFRIGGAGTYANYQIRQGRQQTLSLNREARDAILQQKVIDNEYFSVYMLATGSEFATGENYKVEMIFPRCNLLDSPLSVDGVILAEAGDLQVLEDDTYGSVIVKVTNQVATYAA